ncbi:MAG: hypothetical protein AAFS10_09975 [Myxococcota bacterium]
MTMVVDIGLERYFSDPEAHKTALRRLVEEGFTDTVRDFIDGQLYEATRQPGGPVVSGRLKGAEEEAIRAAFALMPDSYVSFSWDRVDRMDLFHTEELALRLKEGAPRHFVIDTHRARVTDLRHQYADWQAQWSLVSRFHRFAARHHMIIHTA